MPLHPFTVDYSEMDPSRIEDLEQVIDEISFNSLHSDPTRRIGLFFLSEEHMPDNVTLPQGCRVRPGIPPGFPTGVPEI